MLTTDFMNLISLVAFTELPEDPPEDPPVDPPTDPPADPPDDPPDDPPVDEETVPIADLRKVRTEAAKHRKEKVELQTKLDSLEKASEKAKEDAELEKLEGLEKEQARNNQLADKLQKAELAETAANERAALTDKRSAVFQSAADAGFQKPPDAYSLIDMSKIVVSEGVIDQDSVDELVDELAAESPYLLFDEAEGDDVNNIGGPTNPKNTTRPPGPRLAKSKSEVERMRQELKDGQKSGRLTGTAILELRHKIMDAQSGESVQADRTGKPKSESRQERIRRRTSRGD